MGYIISAIYIGYDRRYFNLISLYSTSLPGPTRGKLVVWEIVARQACGMILWHHPTSSSAMQRGRIWCMRLNLSDDLHCMKYSSRLLSSTSRGAGKLRPVNPDLQQNNDIALPYIVPALLNPDECRKIMAFRQGCDQEDGRVDVTGKKSSIRESTVQWLFPSPETEWIFDRIEVAIEQANASYGFELYGFFQGAQVGTYHEHGYYDWHPDMGGGNTSHRKLSISVILSRPDEFAGGDLEFMCIGGQVPRAQGVAIVFPSYLIHRVAPVTSGTRISLVSWISGPPFR